MLAKVLVELARSAGGDLPGALREITATAARALGVERVSVWFYTDDRAAIVCADLFELTPARHSEGTRLTAVDYPAYFAALESARTIDADDARSDARTREFSAGYLTPLGITSMLDASMREEGRVVGVICHEHVGAGRRWTPEEKAFAGSLADFVTIAREADRRRRIEGQLIQSQKEEVSRK